MESGEDGVAAKPGEAGGKGIPKSDESVPSDRESIERTSVEPVLSSSRSDSAPPEVSAVAPSAASVSAPSAASAPASGSGLPPFGGTQEIVLRGLALLIPGAAMFAALEFGFREELGTVYLGWGSLLLVLYVTLKAHPRLTLWAWRFEVFGIVLVAWGTILVSGQLDELWLGILTAGATLMMVLLHWVLARDAQSQIES